MLDHDGDLLVARPPVYCGTPTEPQLIINFRQLLIAMVLDHCVLDGVFWQYVDGCFKQVEGVQATVLQGWCCQGQRPWVQVRIPGRSLGPGQPDIEACAVVLVSAWLGGLTAAKPVSTQAEYLVLAALEIKLARIV
ncbi:hypothetical protein JKP88DRAFT_247992 [Tribonema minus]|uniref:Uncharacterized protein n=1 Tax=Tribonema minus TaxID=303371 RepID=A0A835YNX4_9STRA|nr:hypothetical protein JKP88DRAFT_247992 [Tribonema minus]